MKLYSTVFENGEDIPQKYTCSGNNISPPLYWEDVPADTIDFALIADDPDAPGKTWTHWLLYNIPGHSRRLIAGIAPGTQLASGLRQGQNDFKKDGYGGPCPPQEDPPHRYRFTLYALNELLNLPGGISKQELLDAMKDYILDEARLTGMYKRQKA